MCTYLYRSLLTRRGGGFGKLKPECGVNTPLIDRKAIECFSTLKQQCQFFSSVVSVWPETACFLNGVIHGFPQGLSCYQIFTLKLKSSLRQQHTPATCAYMKNHWAGQHLFFDQHRCLFFLTSSLLFPLVPYTLPISLDCIHTFDETSAGFY